MHAERDEPPDRAVAALALRQHGVLASRQLRALGLERGAVAHRVAVGRLHRIHVGVYAVGHRRLSVRGRWMAAVLTCGPQAALSHASAAALWELRPSTAALVDVAVRTAGGVRARDGIRVHRLGDLALREVALLDAIPVTTVARTLLDLAAILPRRRLERALDQGEVMGHFDLRALRAILDAHPGHHGGGALRRALSSHAIGSTLTRSELEERFIVLCDAQAVPRPLVNARVAGLEVDFVFAAERLVVEVDGFRFHRGRAAFERDRERDAILARAGFRVLRFSHRQLAEQPELVSAALRSSA